jgi:hypothetical protein
MVDICATFCFATETDPQDPIHYTRSGLEVIFRPDGRNKKGKTNAISKPFFQAGQLYADERDLRRDAHKWETTLNRSKRMRGSSLHDPVFDIHYNARAAGRPGARDSKNKIPYALVLTVRSSEVLDLYDRILKKYRTLLQVLQPVVQIPVRATT